MINVCALRMRANGCNFVQFRLLIFFFLLVPGHPPLNVVGRNTSSRSLQINWEPVPLQWQFGIIRGYEVLIKDTNNGTLFVYKIPVNELSLEKGSLERYTNYTIQVAAFTIKGHGNFSKPIIVITDEDSKS